MSLFPGVLPGGKEQGTPGPDRSHQSGVDRTREKDNRQWVADARLGRPLRSDLRGSAV